MTLGHEFSALNALCRRVFLVGGGAFILAAVGACFISRESSGPYALELNLASTTSGTFQVYFDSGTGLTEEHSEKVALFAAPAPLVYRIPLPPGYYTGFRIDPLDRPGSVFITSLAITGQRGIPPLSLDLNRLVPANQIQSLTPEKGGVTIVTTTPSDDPQLLLMIATPLHLHYNWMPVLSRICTISLLPLGLLIIGTTVIAFGSRPRTEAGSIAKAASSGLSTVATSWTGWTLAAFLSFEFIIFYTFLAEAHAATFPRWNDQIQYLGEAYTAYEYAKSHGFLAGLWHALTNPSAQGTLHDVYTLPLFILTGASRTSALSVNILALITWQAATSLAMARRNNSPALIWAAALLPLCLYSAWNGGPGSAVDFRLDYLALCTFGTTMSIGVLSDGFRSRRWSVLFGVAVAALLLTRFLSGTYLTLIYIGLTAGVLRCLDRRPRILNLGISALIVLSLAGPVFWLNRFTIWDYYWIGHFVGPESAIRNQNFDIITSFLYLVRTFSNYHCGSFFWTYICAVTGLVAAGALFFPNPNPILHRSGLYRLGFLFSGAPFSVFLLHAQKSEVVLGAIAPGLLLIVLALWSNLARRCEARWNAGVFAIAALCAAGFFISKQFQPLPTTVITSSQQVGEVSDYMYHRFISGNFNKLYVGVDHTVNSPDAQFLRILCYERNHRWLPFEMTLPTGISEPTEDLVMQRLESTDFILLTEGLASGPWPFDRMLANLRPKLRVWCERNRKLIHRFEIEGRALVLYGRPV